MSILFKCFTSPYEADYKNVCTHYLDKSIHHNLIKFPLHALLIQFTMFIEHCEQYFHHFNHFYSIHVKTLAQKHKILLCLKHDIYQEEFKLKIDLKFNFKTCSQVLYFKNSAASKHSFPQQISS